MDETQLKLFARFTDTILKEWKTSIPQRFNKDNVCNEFENRVFSITMDLKAELAMKSTPLLECQYAFILSVLGSFPKGDKYGHGVSMESFHDVVLPRFQDCIDNQSNEEARSCWYRVVGQVLTRWGSLSQGIDADNMFHAASQWYEKSLSTGTQELREYTMTAWQYSLKQQRKIQQLDSTTYSEPKELDHVLEECKSVQNTQAYDSWRKGMDAKSGG